MGNFSRDPKARLADSVTKQYVGVRLQQAVPVLDADWNELEDLRRHEFETLGTFFIGSGVPSGSDGFRVFSVGQANDFGIQQGLIMVKGRIARNDAQVRYSTQPHFGNPALVPPLAALTTPGTDKEFIVFLDVWEREVDSEEDPALVDIRIGVETAVRLKREWAVRVARVPEDLAGLQTPPPGHDFYPLARLKRKQNNANITTDMIVDLRDTQISVLRKIEVRDSANVVVVDNDRFRLMLENTRNNVLQFIRYISTQFNAFTINLTAGEILGLQAADHIASTAEVALGLLTSDSLANRGALRFLFQVHNAENRFVSIWRDVVLQLGGAVKKYSSYQTFIDRVDERLNQPVINTLPGLLKALQDSNLEGATLMQEDIASLFGAAGANVARGSIQLFLSKTPPGILDSGLKRFEFKVRSFTTMADTYTVKVLPQQGWPRTVVDSNGNPLPNNKISIGPGGSEAIIFVDVVVQSGSSNLQLQVTADSNPSEINQFSTLFTLTQGQPPPQGEDKIQVNLISATGGASLGQQTGSVNSKRTLDGLIDVSITNATGQLSTFNMTLALEDVVGGSWAVTLVGAANPLGPLTFPINNGASVPQQVIVNPSAAAVSMKLRVTVTTVILGSTLTGTTLIQFAAVP